jgi:hypothetical protein
MRLRPLALLVLVLLAPSAGADTDVRTVGDRVEVRAQASTLADVLDTMARHIGMKVVYEGPAPRGRVSFALPAMTPADAVLAALEGQGLTYAIRMDATGTRVETLMVVSGGSTASGTPPRSEPRMPIQHEETPEPEEEPPPPEVPQIQIPQMPQPEKPERDEGRPGRPMNFPFGPTGPGGPVGPGAPGAPGGAMPLVVPPPGMSGPPGMINPMFNPNGLSAARPVPSPAPQQ